MKKLFVCFLLSINISANASAQTKIVEKTPNKPLIVGLKLTLDYNELAKNGFDALNTELEKSQINPLPSAFITQGFSLLVSTNDKVRFEFGVHKIKSGLEKTDNFKSSSIPLLAGQHFKAMCFGEIFKRKRLKIIAGGGLSVNLLVFEIIDLQPQTNSFSNLLTKPSLTNTLAFQSQPITLLEGLIGFDYRLVKTKRGEFTMGLTVGYAYQPAKKKEFVKWTTKNTVIPANSFPLVAMDNYFIQWNMITSLRFD